MKVHYQYKVTYRKYHKTPSPWINNGEPYADKDELESYFKTEEKAQEFISRKNKIGNAIDIDMQHGDFEVDEIGVCI